MTKNWYNFTTAVIWSSLDFHFLHLGEQGHRHMETMVSDLLPNVEGGELRPPDDVELLLCTQHADPGDGGEGGAPVDHLPGNGVGGAAGLKVPNVAAQDGIALVGGIVE